jgi:general secretion pathway protein M
MLLRLTREQMIAVAAAMLIFVLCVVTVLVSLGVRTDSLAALSEQQDAIAGLEARLRNGVSRSGRSQNPAAPPGAFLIAQTQGLAGAELQAHLAQLAASQNADVVSSGVQAASRDDPPETIRLQATLTVTIRSLQGLLHQLETGTPYVFVDSVTVQSPGTAAGSEREDPVLRATLAIRALWRKGTA